MRAGADVNARVLNTLQTPLLAAVSAGKLEPIEKLIELGADVTLPDSKGHTALHLAHFRLGSVGWKTIFVQLIGYNPNLRLMLLTYLLTYFLPVISIMCIRQRERESSSSSPVFIFFFQVDPNDVAILHVLVHDSSQCPRFLSPVGNHFHARDGNLFSFSFRVRACPRGHHLF